MLEQMMRFTDPCLRRILDTMRDPNGKPLTNDDWQALVATELGASQPDGSKTTLHGTDEWYQSSYVWSVTTMASYVKAKQSAIKAKQTLFYFQAVDHTTTDLRSISDAQQKTLFRAFLAHPNLSDTKRLPGYCLLHLTQQVRLTTTLAAPWATQDSTGTVVGIEFDDKDSAANAWRNSVSQPGEVKADMLPIQVRKDIIVE